YPTEKAIKETPPDWKLLDKTHKSISLAHHAARRGMGLVKGDYQVTGSQKENNVRIELTEQGKLKREGKPGPIPETRPETNSKPSLATPAPATNVVHDDVGEKIGGAKKDTWKGRGLHLSDLERMTEKEKYEYLTKDAIWPKPDYKAMANDGWDRTVLRFMKQVRDTINTRPVDHLPENTEAYIHVVSRLRDFFHKGLTVDKVKSKSGEGYFDYFLDTTRVSAEGVHIYRPGLFGAIPDSKVRKIATSHKYMSKYQQEIESTNWPFGATKAKVDQTGDKKDIPKRPHLDKLDRVGLKDYRNGKDVQGDDLLKTFGFRGIEYGNWVDQAERQKSLNMAYDSLMDLADTLNIPPDAMSLNGKLGLAFGARGRGRAAAHYEPVKLVINLTKLSGGGSLAHEWGHALDNYFGEFGAQPKAGKPEYLSGGRKKWRSGSMRIRPGLSNAFSKIAEAILSARMTAEEHIAQEEKAIEETDREIDTWSRKIERELSRKVKMVGGAKFIKQSREWVAQLERRKARAQDNIEALKSGRLVPKIAESRYSRQAHNLSPKPGGYFALPMEMFARAFESYVFDKVAVSGKSEYLVHGVEEARYEGDEYAGNPYPTGKERSAINEAFDGFFQELKHKTDEETGATVLYSLDNGGGVTSEVAQAAVDRFLGEYKGAGKLDIRVVETPRDMGVYAPDNAAAAVDLESGRIWLAMSNLENADHVMDTLVHEVIGHYGIRSLLGEVRFGALVANARAFNKAELEAVARLYGLNLKNKADRAVAVEELIAHLAEVNPESKLIHRAVAAVREFLRRLGVELEYTREEIVELLRQTRQKMKAGEKRNADHIQIKVSSDFYKILGIGKGPVLADPNRLYEKHPEAFESVEDVIPFVEYVLDRPTHKAPGMIPTTRLLSRRNGKEKAVAVEIEMKGGNYMVKSAYVLKKNQMENKIKKAIQQGGRDLRSGELPHGEVSYQVLADLADPASALSPSGNNITPEKGAVNEKQADTPKVKKKPDIRYKIKGATDLFVTDPTKESWGLSAMEIAGGILESVKPIRRWEVNFIDVNGEEARLVVDTQAQAKAEAARLKKEAPTKSPITRSRSAPGCAR
ncbi:MAG: hypothetical protein OEZ32_14115, partial [Nitrospinota bacterium]|nr:hypothetical protein [Nitrospinota bacterium]